MSAPVEPSSVPTLRCRECGEDAPAAGPQYCSWCFGPVEVVLAQVADPGAARAAIGSGPTSLARYRTLLPPMLALDPDGPGWTPLTRESDLGAALGLGDLWVKWESANPTGSFKDRVVEIAVARGDALGSPVVACSSTGNLARACVSAAARRGIAAVLLVPDDLDEASVVELVELGAVVVSVRGGYDAASRLAAEAASDLDHWAWVNVNLRPWYELGARTVAWEIAEQLDWSLPDRVAAPVASGALVRALHEGAVHLVDSGLVVGPLPRLTALQPEGCAPVVTAYDADQTRVKPLARPHTVAASLAMGDPPDGDAVLAAARSTGGVVAAAAEDTIVEACALVADTTGTVVEPAGGVVVAALGRLVAEGRVDPGERVVAVVTGRGNRSDEPAAPAARRAEVVPGGVHAGSIGPSVSELTALVPDELLRRPTT